MRKFGLLGTSALGSTAFIGLSLALAGPASAQMGDQPDDPPATLETEVELESGENVEEDEQSIVVTGSRIRRPNLDSPVPITSVSVAELPNQGQASIGDALNDLPSLRSTFSQQNSGRFIGTAGQNLLDLRGLGTVRTLVLVNGRRHITASPGDFIVDVNTIPQDLLERVDIITGGSSAVYGSDAVAGVVNFVLRRDFEGIRLRGQGGISARGDRSIQFGALTAGQNFADDRGNIAVSLEYTNAEPLFRTQRDYLTGAFSGRNQFNLREPVAGEPTAGDGVTDQRFFRGVRNNTTANGGIINANITAATCANPATDPAVRAARCTADNQPRTFIFNRDGTLTENICEIDFRPFGSGNCLGGRGATLNDTGQLAVGQDRYTANLLAQYEIADSARLFLEAKYVYQEVLQEGQPSFFNATAFPNFFGGGRGLRCDNPFLSAQNIAQLQAVGRCAGGTTSTETLPIGRFNVDFGGRSELDERDTYRIVAGIDGEFNTDWRYELSFNYGKFKQKNIQRNDLVLFDATENFGPENERGFLLATDVVRNAAGQIVCRVNADADPSNDAPGCVPINVFGEGMPSQAALDFVNTTSLLFSNAEQYNVVGSIAGDSSQLFELPGGPIGFAVGAEYRRETAFQNADELSAAGGTFFNAFDEFDPPALEVKEVFGELNVPILRDLSFAEELSVSGAVRYSDYNKGAGDSNTTFAYNINGIYAPIPDLRLRANYSKSVRVPTLGDLFSPFTQNFAFISDPCDVNFINNGTNRAANCAALGIPAGFVNTPARTSSTGFLSGGNPELQEETGKSFTVGAVLTPRFAPGLSITVDYFDIEVTDLISVLSAQAIINNCVDQPSIDNPFCPLINRLPDGTFDDPATISAGVNFAKQVSRGIDFDISYRRTFDNGHRLNLRGLGTYTLERTDFINPTDPEFGNRLLSEFGDPVFSGTAILGYDIGDFDLQYTLRYIGRQINGLQTYESFNEFQGRPPTNPDVLDDEFYPDVFYHDARIGYDVGEDYRFYFGVDNIFDRKPPNGLLGTEGGSPFSSIGRYFYAGAEVDF